MLSLIHIYFHGISPVRLFKALLSDPRIETLMKGGEIEVMKHFLFNTRTAVSYTHLEADNVAQECRTALPGNEKGW